MEPSITTDGAWFVVTCGALLIVVILVGLLAVAVSEHRSNRTRADETHPHGPI